MLKEKIAAILSDEKTMAELSACKTLKEVVDCFNLHGAECTMEEGSALLTALKMRLSKSETMDLDAMDAVAGGGIIGDIWDWVVDKVAPSPITSMPIDFAPVDNPVDKYQWVFDVMGSDKPVSAESRIGQ